MRIISKRTKEFREDSQHSAIGSAENVSEHISNIY
jgi:hypothetical protein